MARPYDLRSMQMLARTALALLLLLPAAAFAQELDTAISALVRISGTRGGTPVRGTGFVVGLDGDKATIVTASHVIEGTPQLEVTFAVDRTESYSAGVVLGMEVCNPRGLAVFQVTGMLPAGATRLNFATEAQLRRGEDLFLVGFPQMATAPLTLRRTFAGSDGNFLQLDLPAGEGFSGAPVLQSGKVVGVVIDEDPRLTFAVNALVAQAAVIGWGGKLGGQTSTPAPVVESCVRGEERTESGIVFVRICPGTFMMGSAANDPRADNDEKPAHQVTLSEFWIGKTEITNEQYRRFRPDYQGAATLPAAGVSWEEAQTACEHFGGRLPTEAEWEYAARAGSRTAWSFGDDEKRLGEYAWYDESSGAAPHPVGMKKPNIWGLYDMHGNVWEWVVDWHSGYSDTPQNDPTGPTRGVRRVLRGGAFADPPRILRSAIRGWDEFAGLDRGKGFRCVRALGKP